MTTDYWLVVGLVTDLLSCCCLHLIMQVRSLYFLAHLYWQNKVQVFYELSLFHIDTGLGYNFHRYAAVFQNYYQEKYLEFCL